MGLTRRVLPVSEWPRLDDTGARDLWRALNPETAEVLVVEDGKRIVGCLAVFPALHADGLWHATGYRQALGHLAVQLRQAVQARGACGVIASILSDPMRRVLGHLRAARLDGEHYALPILGVKGVRIWRQG